MGIRLALDVCLRVARISGHSASHTKSYPIAASVAPQLAQQRASRGTGLWQRPQTIAAACAGSGVIRIGDGGAGVAEDVAYLRMGALSSSLKPEISVYGADGALICSAYTYGAAVDVGPCLLHAAACTPSL